MPAETHSTHGPISRGEVEQLVRERVAEILAVDDDAVRLEARLRDELGADDLSVLDLVEDLETELGERTVGLAVDDDELAELHTVADVVECILGRLDSVSRS